MRAVKITVTLPAKTLKYIDQYRKAHSIESTDEVFEIALAMLRETEREADVSEAPQSDDLSELDTPVQEDAERGQW
jgi:hypothetical protein